MDKKYKLCLQRISVLSDDQGIQDLQIKAAQLMIRLCAGHKYFGCAQYQEPTEKWNGIILVGEAPAAEEVKAGLPFQGRSGTTLRRWLAKCDVKIDSFVVCNTFRIRPPMDCVEEFFFLPNEEAEAAGIDVKSESSIELSKKVYLRPEFKSEIDHLHKTIKDKKPAVVVALGKIALWAIAARSDITDVCADTCEIKAKELPGIIVMGAYHPSNGLRPKSREPEAIAVLRTALKIAKKNAPHP